jgi:hypothetical protein
VNDDETGRPRRILVQARGSSVDLRMELDVGQTTVSGPRSRFGGGRLDFLQMRAQVHLTGRVGNRTIDARAPGSAETFRGR